MTIGRFGIVLGRDGEPLPGALPADEVGRELYLQARWLQRELTLAHPLLDFDSILFVERVPGSFNHMSDQYLGWWSRPGGGIYVMEDFTSGAPTLTCLTEDFPAGSFLRPSLSYDGTKILFAWCRYYPHVAKLRDSGDKDHLPEDYFYQVFEMNVDGMLARAILHEFDHLEGVLFIDRMSPLTRTMIKGRLKKLQQVS